MPSEHAVAAEWEEARTTAYRLAKGLRKLELRGERAKRFDGRGLHVLSLEVGRIYACQALLPELRDREFDPLELVRAAEAEAVAEVQNELREGTWSP